MTVFTWPATFKVDRFEMRLMPNTRTFVGPYTPSTQVLDLLGERWVVSLNIVAGRDPIQGAAQEAFFDRLKGPANLISMSYLRRSLPQGTLRDSDAPVLTSAVAQMANTFTITAPVGRTLLAGDHFGVGSQLFRAMATTTADGSGHMVVEVQPRARVAYAGGAVVTCTAPTANFMLKADGVPTVWNPGSYDASTLDLIEFF